MDQTFMKEKKILPLILSMSLPMVISMAVNALYNIIDSYFVARISEDAMTALSLVYPMQNMVTAIAVGFGIGINANIAFFLGAGEQKKANLSATLGLCLSIIHGILITLLCFFIMPSFLRLFSSDLALIEQSLLYSNKVFLFSCAITVGICFEKIFQSVGKMTVSMVSMLCGCIINIILDPILIFGIGIFPAMGIEGAALATGISQCVTLVIYIVLFIMRPIPVQIKRCYMRPDPHLIKRLYGIGIPATLNMALPSLQVSALNYILADFSDKYILVLGIYYKLQTFIYLTANGIIQGIRPLISYNAGACEYKRIKEIFRTSLSLIMLIMLIGTGLSLLMPQQLIALFTDSETTIQIGAMALRIISLGFVISSVSVTCSGALEGLGKGVSSMYISLSRYVIIMIPAAYLLSRLIGQNGVWIAFVVTEVITALLSAFIYKNVLKK